LIIIEITRKRRHIRMGKKVIVYTQETCPPCFAEKEWLKANHIDFEERDIRKNQSYMQEVMALGASATPVTVVTENGNQDVVMGFQEETLKALLNI
jgi:glutaredoxin